MTEEDSCEGTKQRLLCTKNRLAEWLERASSISWKICSCGEFHKAALSRLWKSANLITSQPNWQIETHGLLKLPPECGIYLSSAFVLHCMCIEPSVSNLSGPIQLNECAGSSQIKTIFPITLAASCCKEDVTVPTPQPNHVCFEGVYLSV